jgi:hypothetical protein
LRRVEAPLVPVLRLSTAQVLPAPWGNKSLRGYRPDGYANLGSAPEPMSHARLFWRYGDKEIGAESDALHGDHYRDEFGQWTELRRDFAAEGRARMSCATTSLRSEAVSS